MLIKRSDQLSVSVILFAILLAFSCVTGCLQRAIESIQMPPTSLADKSVDSRLQMDYDVELNRDLFRLQGDLHLPDAQAYIMLNASLRQGEHPILTAKYLLMQVVPDHEYGFEICKSCRLRAGEYDCTLRVEGPRVS